MKALCLMALCPCEADLHVSKFAGNSYLQLLTCWIRHAHDSASRLSTGEFWDCGELLADPAEKSYAHSIGRLRRLEKMPKLIGPLFTTLGEKWDLVVRHFSLDEKNELHRLDKYAPFRMIFSFYKKAGARSNNPPAFIAKLHLAQRLLKERHGKCRCQWGRSLDGWNSCWVKTNPSGWPCWSLKCPYELAIDDLGQRWGNSSDQQLSSRQAE